MENTCVMNAQNDKHSCDSGGESSRRGFLLRGDSLTSLCHGIFKMSYHSSRNSHTDLLIPEYKRQNSKKNLSKYCWMLPYNNNNKFSFDTIRFDLN